MKKASNPLRDDLLSFLRDPTLQVLTISGPWGCGKTHWLRQFLDTEHRLLGHLNLRPAYISLFGVVSISELKRKAVIAAKTPRSTPADPAWDWLCYWGTWLLTKTRANLPRSLWGFSASALGEIVEEFAFSSGMNGLLLCIDDLERRSPRMRILDILGTVEELAEQRQCKVILVLNSEALGTQSKDYRLLEEKVVDRTVVFRPAPASLAQLVFDEDLSFVAPILDKLSVSNVRVMRRIRTVIRDAERMSPQHLFAVVRARFAAQVAKYVSFHLVHPDAFEIGSLRTENRFARMLARDESSNEIDKKRLRLLNDVDFYPEDFDEHIVHFIKGEPVDKEALERTFLRLSQDIEASDAQGEFDRIWDLYHDNFAVTSNEFVQKMVTFLERRALLLKPQHVIVACEVCLSLPHDALLRERIKEFLRAPLSAMGPESRASLTPKYPLVAGLAEAANFPFLSTVSQRGIEEVFELATKDGGWDPQDLKDLAEFPDDVVFHFLSAYKGSRLLSRLDDLLKLRVQTLDETGHARRELLRKFKRALAQLAARDELHKSKIRRHLGESFLEEQNGDAD